MPDRHAGSGKAQFLRAGIRLITREKEADAVVVGFDTTYNFENHPGLPVHFKGVPFTGHQHRPGLPALEAGYTLPTAAPSAPCWNTPRACLPSLWASLLWRRWCTYSARRARPPKMRPHGASAVATDIATRTALGRLTGIAVLSGKRLWRRTPLFGYQSRLYFRQCTEYIG